MTLKIVVATSVDGDVYELILTREKYRVGRRNDNDLRVKEPYISNYHSEIRRTEVGDYELADLGSANGTFLDGKRVETPVKISAGDFITFGIFKVAVQEHTEALPKVVSRNDRPVIAKVRREIPSETAVSADTGAVGKLETATAAVSGRMLSPEDDGRNAKLETELAERDGAFQSNVRESDASHARFEESEANSRKSLSEKEEAMGTKIAFLESEFEKERSRATGSITKNESLTSRLAEIEARLENAQEEVNGLRECNAEISRNNGRLQAELDSEKTNKAQLIEDLSVARQRADQRLSEIENLQEKVASRGRELAETEQRNARSEIDAIQKIKRELSEAKSSVALSEKEAANALKEKLELSGSYGRLKEQLTSLEQDRASARIREKELLESNSLLSEQLDKSENANSELAARIKEEASCSIAGRELIQKLEAQLRENESESLRKEVKQAAEMQSKINSLSARLQEEERQRSFVSGNLARESAERKASNRKIIELEERIMEFESAAISLHENLKEGEKKRSRLETDLAETTAAAKNHAKVSEDLKSELAATIARSERTEHELHEKHRIQVDRFLEELREERDQKNELIADLENTRAGMSEAIRHAKEHGECEKAELLAQGQVRLAESEEELSRVIHSREKIEKSRSALEDELNVRDEQIERLGERVEDLEWKLRDDEELRSRIVAEFENTKAGLSKALHSNRLRLAETEANLKIELDARDRAETTVAEQKDKIQKLRADSEKRETRFAEEIKDCEKRFSLLQEEQLTLANENANLKKVREQIEAANAEKGTIEGELFDVKAEMNDFNAQRADLETQKEKLLKEREELKAELNHARSELDATKKRQGDSQRQDVKLGRSIASAEKRIQSLKKLESEIEQAVERKRQQGILSRSGVFSNGATAEEPLAPPLNGMIEDEGFCRKLIGKLDLLDDLTKRYENKWRYPKVADQLAILKRSFLDLLNDHSVRAFDLEPGTILSINERRRIKLVPLPEKGSRASINGQSCSKKQSSSKVIETVRPGYVFQNGSKDIVIRKAEVIVA